MAFEVFVRRAVEQLRADVKGWSEKARALRAACATFLGAPLLLLLGRSATESARAALSARSSARRRCPGRLWALRGGGRG